MNAYPAIDFLFGAPVAIGEKTACGFPVINLQLNNGIKNEYEQKQASPEELLSMKLTKLGAVNNSWIGKTDLARTLQAMGFETYKSRKAIYNLLSSRGRHDDNNQEVLCLHSVIIERIQAVILK